MNVKSIYTGFAVLLVAATAHAQHSWVLPYAGPEDSPFQEFGMQHTYQLEDFEAGQITVSGLTLLPATEPNQGSFSITSTPTPSTANSVASDTGDPSTGKFLLGQPTTCATSFPLLCPATAALQFGAMDGQLPTFVGFVWTDAVRSRNPVSGLPFGVATAYRDGEVLAVERVFDLPPLNAEDVTADDIFIGFVDNLGIERLDFQVVTDREGGFLSMDHVQFGMSAIPGDANRDGRVNFADFLSLADNYGRMGNWSQGDFNHDGDVAFVDFLQLAENFGSSAAASATAIPEPSGLLLAVLAAVATLALRCRSSRER